LSSSTKSSPPGLSERTGRCTAVQPLLSCSMTRAAVVLLDSLRYNQTDGRNPTSHSVAIVPRPILLEALQDSW
jgi:hypothetical protein